MKKLNVAWLVISAVVALCLSFAPAASAENTLSAEWLNNGEPVTSALSSEASGELLLEDTSNKGAVVCSGVLMGTVGSNGVDEITSVLKLSGSGPLVLGTEPVLCKAASGSACEENATDIEVAPHKLPWKTLLFLDEATGNYLDAVWNVGYSVTCLVVIKITDECEIEGVGTQEVHNVTGGVEAIGAIAPRSKCSIGGKEVGIVEPQEGNLLTLASAGPLAMSPPPEATLSAEWLNNGEPVTSALSSEASGELLLEDTSNKGAVVCSGVLMGTVGSNGVDEITSVLKLSGSGPLVLGTEPVLCKAASGSACEENATDIEVAPHKLPWKTLLFLDEATGNYLDAVWNVGYSVTCLVVIKITDECEIEGVGTQEVHNVTGGVEAIGAIAPRSKCSIGGKEVGIVEPQEGNLETAPGAGPLSLSSAP